MKTQILILALALFLVLPLISGACAEYGTYKQNTDVALIQTCTTCSGINASIVYPDGTQTGSFSFQNIDNVYNYTFTDTTQLGTYNVIGLDAWCYYFDVNSDGSSGNIGWSFIIILIIALILFLGFYTEELWVIILGGLFMLVLGFYYLINGIMGITDPLLNVFISAMIMVVGFYISVKSSLDIINDKGGSD